MELQLKVVGVILVILALIHIIFPRYFNWRNEFKTVSRINREMMYVHTFFIALILLLMGLMCLLSSREIIESDLGRKFALGLAVFWAFRLVIQFFGYSSELWRGKFFETTVHVVFSILWMYLTTVFFLIYRS